MTEAEFWDAAFLVALRSTDCSGAAARANYAVKMRREHRPKRRNEDLAEVGQPVGAGGEER